MARGGQYVGETGMHRPTEQREYCNTTLSMFLLGWAGGKEGRAGGDWRGGAGRGFRALRLRECTAANKAAALALPVAIRPKAGRQSPLYRNQSRQQSSLDRNQSKQQGSLESNAKQNRRDKEG